MKKIKFKIGNEIMVSILGLSIPYFIIEISNIEFDIYLYMFIIIFNVIIAILIYIVIILIKKSNESNIDKERIKN